MNFLNPWDHIKIYSLQRKDNFNFFDSRIHILFVLDGEVEVKIDNKTIILKKDNFYIIPKAVAVEATLKTGKGFLYVLDYFSKNDKENYSYAFRGNNIDQSKPTDSNLIYYLKQILLSKIAPSSNTQTAILQKYFSLLVLLEEYYRVELRQRTDKNIKSQIEDIKFYIDNNFEKEIRLSDLAEQLYVTEQYLSRIFKEQNGIGISEYLIKCRLAKVRQLLLETDDSITDIAYSSGFSNINSFNRLFKKYQGVTPSEYRFEIKKNLKIEKTSEEEKIVDFEEAKEYLVDSSYTTEKERISINTEVDPSWSVEKQQMMINLGYAGDLIYGSLVKELASLNNFTSFDYGRTWGILSDSILHQKDDRFDFTKVDEILQNILDLKLIPFLDLGFKGKQIHESISKVVNQENFELPNNQFSDILERYRVFMEHIVEQFGYENVRRWKIEIWKPNHYVLETLETEGLKKLVLEDTILDISKNSGYFYFFSQVKTIIQSIIPEIAVGGSGLSLDLERQDYQSFIEEWSNEEIKPDFLTVSMFSFDGLKHRPHSKRSSAVISANTHLFKELLQNIKECLDESKLCSTIIVSEFNVTISSRDLINDTAFKGPYILKNLIDIWGICEIVGYWLASDQSFSTIDVNKQEIFGGSGLISKNGIPKPSFFAFDFLNNLEGKLLYQSEGVVVIKNQNKISLLLYHYCHLNNLYYFEENRNLTKLTIGTIFDDDGKTVYQFEIGQLKPNSVYKIKSRYMGVNHGAFLTQLNGLSLDDHFSQEEVNYLKLRCIPELSREKRKTNLNGELKYQVELEPHDMILVEIEK